MKLVVVLSILVAGPAVWLFADRDAAPPPAPALAPAAAATPDESPGEKPSSAPSREERRAALEKAFQEALDGATLVGKFRLVKDGRLGPERGDRYTLGKVSKVKGDRWTIEARIQYGEKDVRIPVPVKVLWAGDTPVITVDKLWLPGLGRYTARVVIHEGLYAGTWFGTGYGGLLSGVLEKPEAAKPEVEKPPATPAPGGK